MTSCGRTTFSRDAAAMTLHRLDEVHRVPRKKGRLNYRFDERIVWCDECKRHHVNHPDIDKPLSTHEEK